MLYIHHLLSACPLKEGRIGQGKGTYTQSQRGREREDPRLINEDEGKGDNREDGE